MRRERTYRRREATSLPPVCPCESGPGWKTTLDLRLGVSEARLGRTRIMRGGDAPVDHAQDEGRPNVVRLRRRSCRSSGRRARCACRGQARRPCLDELTAFLGLAHELLVDLQSTASASSCHGRASERGGNGRTALNDPTCASSASLRRSCSVLRSSSSSELCAGEGGLSWSASVWRVSHSSRRRATKLSCDEQRLRGYTGSASLQHSSWRGLETHLCHCERCGARGESGQVSCLSRRGGGRDE